MRQAIIASGKHCGVRTCCAPMARRSTRRQLTTEDKNTEETPKHLVLVGFHLEVEPRWTSPSGKGPLQMML